MTQVWKTRYGGRYHRYERCPGIADGHAKAASEGYGNHPATEMDLGELDGAAVAPCLVCWGPEIQQDRWLSGRLTAELVADSPYEVDFYDGVLRHVQGLDPDSVRVQHEATGASGTRYRVDYAILRPGEQAIAIEIDGFQKEWKRNEADEARQGSMSARQNDLGNADWKFLRFTNRQATTAAGACRAEIETALQRRISHHPVSSPTPVSRQTTNTSPPVARASEPRPLATEGSSPSRRRWFLGAASLVLIVGGAVWFVTHLDSGGDGSAPPSGSICPASHQIKGNVADDGERIYHRPGDRYYDVTVPEECFDSGAAAEDAGYRPSKL